jgi:bacterioferritin
MSAQRELNNEKTIAILNRVLEQELAGVVRYTHFSLMVFGYGRIPIVSWLRSQGDESLAHAIEAGEMITHLGGYPSLSIGALLDTHRHDIGDILREALQAESEALEAYRDLLAHTANKSVMLEEYARRLIAAEESHIGEVDKMLRKPGDVAAYRSQ